MVRAGAYRGRMRKRIRPGNTPSPWLAGMKHSQPAHSGLRPPRATALTLVGLLLLVAVGAVATASMRLEQPDVHVDRAPGGLTALASPLVRTPTVAAAPVRRPQPKPAAATTSVLDESRATVARLDPALLGALRKAANAAAAQGIRLQVTSGWRSAERQAELLRDAVARYGSAAEAARWVATPQRSEHVSGDAVDLGPAEAVTWLARHGSAFGLCQVYGNEPWHFELRPGAVESGCPATYADPTQDPRMQP